ncbi:hypothetical protein D9M68_569720 [compost metagenome]
MHTKAEQTKIEKERVRRDLDHVVCSALHIIHESYLFGSNLWPRKGGYAGYPEENSCDKLYVSARIDFEINKNLAFVSVYNKTVSRSKKQIDALELILDHAVYENVIFMYSFSYAAKTYNKPHGILYLTFEFI